MGGMSEGTREAASAQHHRLLDTIGMRIVEGELPQGTRLLTADVAAELGVSRSAMREVVRVLETMGMVEVRRRAGVEVLPVERWSAYAPEVLRWRLDGSDRLRALHELSQLRSAIEPLAARLAATQADPAQRAALVKAVLGIYEQKIAVGQVPTLRGHRLKRLLFRMLDADEFLSDYGVRSLSLGETGVDCGGSCAPCPL